MDDHEENMLDHVSQPGVLGPQGIQEHLARGTWNSFTSEKKVELLFWSKFYDLMYV